MPLSSSELKSNILKVLDEVSSDPGPNNLPLLSMPVAAKLASAYSDYAGKAIASGMTPSGGSSSTIASELVKLPLMAGWTLGLTKFWGAVTFAGPGFIPKNPTIPVGITISLAPALTAYMNTLVSSMSSPSPIKQTKDMFAENLANLLHNATMTVIVTGTTTSAPPVVSPLPLS